MCEFVTTNIKQNIIKLLLFCVNKCQVISNINMKMKIIIPQMI